MIRIRLLKQYKHPNKLKAWPVGQIIQASPYLASELIADKIGEVYKGEYPPKEKQKIQLKNLNK